MTGVALLDDDRTLVAALRDGDERAFGALVDRYHTSFIRVAQSIVHDRSVAEEVAQETWLAVLRGIDGFQQRSALRTWLYRIVVNIARGLLRAERRTIPLSALAGDDMQEGQTAVERYLDRSAATGAREWRSTNDHWDERPDLCLLSKQTGAALNAAINMLPDRQRAVLQLHDVEGFSSEEICELLGLSMGNQRVLLHRARVKIRAALEDYLRAATAQAV